MRLDGVALEIAATLGYVGVPEKEHQEFMDIIESYHSMVVAEPGLIPDRARTVVTDTGRQLARDEGCPPQSRAWPRPRIGG